MGYDRLSGANVSKEEINGNGAVHAKCVVHDKS